MAGLAAVEAKDELIEIGLQMLATQPVVDASRPAFEVGDDLVDPRQDEVSGGLPDDMDIVAMGGERSVAGPAVGFRDGVGIGGGFDEVSEVCCCGWPVGKWSGAERLSTCPQAPAGRVEAAHAACRVGVSMGSPVARYRARHRGPWKTANVPSGYSCTLTVALT